MHHFSEFYWRMCSSKYRSKWGNKKIWDQGKREFKRERASGWKALVGPEGCLYGLEKNGSGTDHIDRPFDNFECIELRFRFRLLQRIWVGVTDSNAGY